MEGGSPESDNTGVVSLQIKYVHGYLFTNVKFWEKVLEAPSPIIECIK